MEKKYTKQEVIELVQEYRDELAKNLKLSIDEFLTKRGFIFENTVDNELLKEAKIRGFVDGVEYISPVGKYRRKVLGELKVNASRDVYDDNGYLVYSSSVGLWGEVIAQEK